MNKKVLIMILIPAAGIISFAGAFGMGWFTAPPAEVVAAAAEPAPAATTDPNVSKTAVAQQAVRSNGLLEAKAAKSISEKQLEELIYDIREKVRQYEDKLQSLGVREQRQQLAQDLVKKDIEELNRLQVELASQVAAIREQQDLLEKSKVEISKMEQENFIKIAAFYDKMDASSASKILSNMTRIKSSAGSGDFDDAIKILHYMTERTKAKLLAELSNTEPDLAAAFCKKLKRVVEIN